MDGNSSDKTSFKEAVERPANHLQEAGVEVMVTDSAGYTQGTIQPLQKTGVTWVMSVPGTLKEAKRLIEGVNASEFTLLSKGYQFMRVETSYAGVLQRWLLIRSDAARERATKTVERQLFKRSENERKTFDALRCEEFLCEEDAWKALERYQARSRVLDVVDASVTEKRHYHKRGRPAADAEPESLPTG